MPSKKSLRIMPWLLVLLPIWLVASATFALLKYFKNEKTDLIEAEKRFSQSVSTKTISDDLRKFITIIGERNLGKPAALSATASMISGSLGPANTGYEIELIEGPAAFPLLKVSLPSTETGAAPVWIITSYDSPRNSRGAEKNATGLTATIAAARARADSTPARPVHFLFLPHGNEAESPLLETATKALNLIRAAPSPRAILCIEAMGDAETLILSSRDTEALPTREFSGLGQVLGAEVTCLGDDFDLSSTLFELGLPAIRLATRPTLLPDEQDEKLPFTPTLAASTGRLIELIERLSQ